LKRILFLTLVICMGFYVASSFAMDTEPQGLQTAVRKYIETNMPWPQGTVRITFLPAETEPIPPDSRITLRIESAGSEDYIGDMTFWVKFFKNGILVRTETVRTRIEVLRNIVIAARLLPHGTVLADTDIRTVSKWSHRITPHALSTQDKAVGKRLTSQVNAGTEISANMLRDVPMVQKGKIVKIIFDSGAMRIVTVGIPEEDGMAGTIIRVRNVTSNKIIYARVLGASLVGIEL